jgi:hypothetical protein
MAKKKSNSSATANNNGQIKYDDPRDAYFSTKKEMVVATTEFNLNMFYKTAMNDVAVIAEDKHGYYITGKSFVNASVLDPYRQYHRNTITVNKTDAGFDIEFDNNLYSVKI